MTPTPTPTPTPPPDPDQHTDTFTQETRGQVDIVWVVDDSGSMLEEQNAIETNADAFTQRLIDAAVDFRLIVVTTDATTFTTSSDTTRNQCGVFITPANAELFGACVTDLGTGGGGGEEGIEAARRAIDPAPINMRSPIPTIYAPRNPGFLRDEADLQIIFVSDEEDQPQVRTTSTRDGWDEYDLNFYGRPHISETDLSALEDEMTDDLSTSATSGGLPSEGREPDGREAYYPLLDAHEAFFDALKSNPFGAKFTAHAIIQTSIDGSDDCHSRLHTEEVGERYRELAQRTNGTVSDVCSDWSTTMDAVGLAASGLLQCFQLELVPTLGEASIVEVRMNTGSGFAVVPRSEWTYEDPPANRVCFATIPPEAASIEIVYY